MTNPEKEAREPAAALPLVTIVGRPNVGKSTLFNRLVGERRSIVGDEPGITRDRIYGEAEWAGRRFSLVDTGGIVPDDDAIIPSNILKQAEAAIDEAMVLVWVVDVRAGVTPLDEELARLLRSTGKMVLVAANKTDATRLEADAGEFYQFGFDDVIPLSAENSDGVAELLDAVVERLTPAVESDADPNASREIRLAIIGRPNVGKSSLLNRLLGAERVIVSPIAGTTRDTVDTLLEVPAEMLGAEAGETKGDGAEGETGVQRFRLIDTAGIRRKGKTELMAEKLAVLMARRSLERADVAVVVIDATEGVAALDANIAGYAVDAGCSIIVAVNKWDAVPDKETGTPFEFERNLRDKMKFLDWAPVVTLSALTGQRVSRLLSLAVHANRARNHRVSTSQLNDFFERAIDSPRAPTAPAPVKGGQSRLHIQYVTQIGVRPPRFVVFTAGGRGGIHFSYERYLQNRLREEFDFFATPIRIIERHKRERRKK
ncbi:MAG: ribosome biogenesis GTPase Der [Acidobacteriota bacterium]|nr:ribosome biogenesis GTPase Der [Acidobacteriota bacterium]